MVRKFIKYLKKKKLYVKYYTGHLIMFSMITNIYNKKTKGRTLMELFTAIWKLKKFLLTTRDVWCVHHGWHGTYQNDIQVLATHASVWVHLICFTAAMIRAFSSARSHGSGGTNTRSLIYPQRKNHKYLSYSYPIINFCNPGVHYETLCIITIFSYSWATLKGHFSMIISHLVYSLVL
jgi:hypothetical protein